MDIDAHLDPQRPCAFLHTVWINVEGKNTREGITVDEEKGERGGEVEGKNGRDDEGK